MASFAPYAFVYLRLITTRVYRSNKTFTLAKIIKENLIKEPVAG
ncbi:hypothetical protein A464_3621 [Salmonella bongori N268-08]|uniref:Uncharacterized protein n=1 Tax=Salmonella bongori N268-08 TaxID=1197719 RepID=S5NDS6_SALBN|nr:hypothetical protein A464_3621 [Salmonella bongori N268-08]